MKFEPVNIEIYCEDCDETFIVCDVSCIGMEIEGPPNKNINMKMSIKMKDDKEIESFIDEHGNHKIWWMRYVEKHN